MYAKTECEQIRLIFLRIVFRNIDMSEISILQNYRILKSINILYLMELTWNIALFLWCCSRKCRFKVLTLRNHESHFVHFTSIAESG